MPFTSKTLLPGLLVGLKTKIAGDNVDYAKTVIEEEHVDELGQLIGAWRTDKTIADAAEFKRATEVRSKARNLVTGVCAKSDFGYLCPESKVDQLEIAIDKAAALCDDFNRTAMITSIEFNTLTGRIATDDVKAIKAIKGELAELLAEMAAGVKNLDPERTRAAANKAKRLGTMLAPEQQKEVQEYIDSVRKLAVEIKKAGDQAATVVNEEVLKGLANARTAFLDIDGAVEVEQAEVVGRALDLDPDVVAPVAEDDILGPAPDEVASVDEALTVATEEQARELDLEDMLS
jgi:hypothetical protein